MNEISHDSYLFEVNEFFRSAWIGHAPFLKFLIRELKPKSFVELGVHNGFSYFLACQAIVECGLETKAFAIDHWQGDSQAGYFEDTVYEDVVRVNEKYSRFSTLLKMRFQDAIASFGDKSIELLHIDGFHSYESVKEDFESWLPKLSPNGIVLIHDIHVHRNNFGVYKFWDEVKNAYKTIEFVGSHGLGVVFLGRIPEGAMRQVFEICKKGKISAIQGTFGSISDDVLQNSQSFAVKIAVDERDKALAERDKALAERDLISNSTIWRFFAPYRRFKKLL